MDPQELQDYLSPIYQEYNEVIKPLIADIETKEQKFPVELFNEIRSCHDHIARCYYPRFTDEQINNEIRKADQHVKRTVLDCYKFLNVYFYEYIKDFEEKHSKKVDLSLVNDGEFKIKYKKLHREAHDCIRQAKECESKDKDACCKLYEKAYIKFSNLQKLIEDNYVNIIRLHRKKKLSFWLQFFLWFGTIIITSIVAELIGTGWVKTSFEWIAGILKP